MTRQNVLLWLGIALAAILVSLALLIAPEYGVPRWVFVPIAVVGLLSAYVLGVRKAKSASLRLRVFGGVFWAVPWLLLLCLPWGIVSAAYLLERTFLIRPPDVSTGRPSGTWTDSEGFQYLFYTNAPWPDVEAHFHEQLHGRGWRREWVREFSNPIPPPPPGKPHPRWFLYRRFDGLMLVSLAAMPNGKTSVVLQYDYLRWDFEDTSQTLREVSPTISP